MAATNQKMERQGSVFTRLSESTDVCVEMTTSALMSEVVPAQVRPYSKVSIVGVGQVGMACAYSILVQNVASEICLVDVQADKLQGEMMDLQHGLAFTKQCRIKADIDYAITEGSKVCIVTAGARQREGETRLSLVQRNVNIFKGIIPQLVKYSPDTIILVVSNPVDVLTWATWKLSGLPKERIIGSGTNLDSARFRFLMSERLNIAPSSCHGWIIGEHGDSSVAVWSGVNIAGVPLKKVNPDIGTERDVENWANIHQEVIQSAYEIIRLKGYTSWAIGLSVANICNAILKNTRNLFALSVNVKGMHGITEEVYLSLPAVVGENGVTHIIRQKLTEEEVTKLRTSSATLFTTQQGIEF